MRSFIASRTLAAFALMLALAIAGSAAAEKGQIPITTASEQARKQYLDGRELLESLRGVEGRALFLAATGNDPDFALAWLALARTATTSVEFFDALDRAVALSSKVSDGERFVIKGFDAGVKGDPAAQLDQYVKLVAAYPNDSRAHNLMGNYYLGRQDWDEAIKQYNAAITINPDFSQPYNQLGYVYRFLERYDDAEMAFTRYIELVPEEPNPYDSQAELLMKVGRFEESIESYREALSLDPHFAPSYFGIGNNYIFLGDTEEARRTLDEFSRSARNSAEKRQALFWKSASYLYDGNYDKALLVARERLAIAERDKDLVTMSGDLNFIGDIYFESSRPADAISRYAEAVEVMERSDAPEEVKEAIRVNYLYEEARVALTKGDITKTRAKMHAYRLHVNARQIPSEVRRYYELAGMVAAYEQSFFQAVHYYARADQQNPRVLYMTAVALRGNGEEERAEEVCRKAAEFNGLNIDYAYVKTKAEEMLAESGSEESDGSVEPDGS